MKKLARTTGYILMVVGITVAVFGVVSIVINHPNQGFEVGIHLASWGLPIAIGGWVLLLFGRTAQ